MSLIEIKSGVYYLPGGVNLGVIITPEKGAILIDSGNDDDAGKKALRALESAGFALKVVINTHAHGDHIGGNSFLQRRTGAKIYASAIETCFVQFPELEPFYLFSGTIPMRDLKNKFLQAKPSTVHTTLSPGKIEVEGCNLEIVNLPGHSLGQIGVVYNQVLFAGDAYFSPQTIGKHGVPLYIDIEAELSTLTWLEQSTYEYYLGAHAPLTREIKPVVDANRTIIEGTIAYVRSVLDSPQETSEVIKLICDHYGVNIQNATQYYLMNSTGQSYLSYLYNKGEIRALYQDNRIFWQVK